MGKTTQYPFHLQLFNVLYKKSFFMYNIAYFLYKRLSDRKKIKFLLSKVKPNMKILDIGANIGFYTIWFSRLIGNSGHIFSFEPDETNFSHLKKNTRKLLNVTLCNVAVSNKTEKIKLFFSKELNVDHQTYDIGENRDYKIIDAIAIDDYLYNEPQIDLIKIDIQGYDYYALIGMEKIVSRSKPIMLYGEFWPFGLKKAGVEPQQYIKKLEQMGFEITFFNNNIDLQRAVENKFYYTDFFGIKK